MKNSILAIFFGLLFFSCQPIVLPEPITASFEKTYGEGGIDYAMAGTILNDYIYLIGTSNGRQPISGGLLLVKIDQMGKELFQRSYGGNISDGGGNIISTSDGNLLLLGRTRVAVNSTTTQDDIFLLKVTPDGDTLWTRTYGDLLAFDTAKGLIETDDGGILLLGGAYNGSLRDFRAIRLDAQGNEIWRKVYTSPYDDNGVDIARAGNDHYLLFGRRQAGDDDFYTIKINGQGDSIWTASYGTPYYEEGHSIYKTQDNGFILCGHSSGVDPLHNLYLVKIDADGKLMFEKNYGGAMHDGGTDAVELDNGDFLLVGETDSHGNGSKRGFFVHTDSSGNIVEERSYGGDLSDKFSAILLTNSAHYLIGESASFSQDTKADCYVVKRKNNE
ncbi:hypothetical protein [Aureispira anguillae]|nr:hypothetical protein [Aureispira anguillae]